MIDAAMPVRPSMPTTQDEGRSRHSAMRYRLLTDRWDDDLKDYLFEQIDREVVLASWGTVDTSANPIADLCRQLTTPGLYGRRPLVRHPGGHEEFIGPGGWLERCGWYARGQHLQYLTLGMGNVFARFGLSTDGKRLTYRFVLPQNVWVRTSPDEPGRIVELWELRVRMVLEKPEYCWEQYRLEPAPRFRVIAATGTLAGEDVTGLVVGVESLADEGYPWRSKDGEPRLPFVMYRDRDTGEVWNHWHMHALHRGTFNVATAWTMVHQSARHATASVVAAWGLEPPSQTARGGDQHGPPSAVLQLTPGAFVYHTVKKDETIQPGLVEIGPGVNLPNLQAYADSQEMRQAVRMGLNPSDLSRTAANPASAAALMVSNEGKREMAAQVEPVFRASDLDAIACAAMVLRGAALGEFPEDGYAIEYYQIPRSATEQRDRRDEQDWELDHGLISLVDVYLERHPGSTREDAIAEIRRVKADEAGIGIDPATSQTDGPPPPDSLEPPPEPDMEP